MAKKKKNTTNGASKRKKKDLIAKITKGDSKTKGNWGASGIQWGRDLLLGGLAGGGLGHLAGRPGALIGILANGIAYIGGYPGLASVGTGMIAGGLFKSRPEPTTTNPNKRLADGSVDDGGFPNKKGQFQARLKDAGDAIKYNLYLDKLFTKKEKDSESKGGGGGTVGFLGSPTLDEIEAQLLTSAMNFQREQGGAVMAGPEEDFEEAMTMSLEDEDDFEEEIPTAEGFEDGFGEEEFEFEEDM